MASPIRMNSVHPLPNTPSSRATTAPGTAASVAAKEFPKTVYSTTKFLALQEYTATASRWRIAAVLLLTPAPAFIGSVLPSFVPLQDPTLGQDAIPSTLLHSAIIIFLVSFGTIILTLGATATPRRVYSEAEGAGVAVVTTSVVIAFSYVMYTYWLFPQPFSSVVTAFPWGISLPIVHAILLRHKFKQHPHLAASLARYAMPLALQSSQFGIYVGLTVLFDGLDTIYQVLMVAAFPLVKFALKKLMRKYTKTLDEMSAEVALSAVEICASLYQSMIMQTTPSALALGVIMGVDLVQGVIAIKYYMGRCMKTPRREVFAKATEILRCCEQQQGGDPRDMSSLRSKLNESDALVVKEALELASATDGVLLIEYFEVSVPIVNALFLLATFRTSSTRYNMRLYNFYENPELVTRSTASVLLYSALQGVSLMVMHFVLKKRHNSSAFHHLAFVLEYHARSIQGKLVTFFPLIFYFTLIHYGADFTLRFDFVALMDKMNRLGK